MTKTKFEAMELLNEHDIPCGPILSMKELAEEPSLRATGTIVEVDHPKRGKYLTVGNPIKMSDSPTDVKRSPLLGRAHATRCWPSSATEPQEIVALRGQKVDLTGARHACREHWDDVWMTRTPYARSLIRPRRPDARR